MNLTALRNLVTSKAGRQLLLAQKHSPTLMVATGTVGFVATVVLASRATLKLDEILEKAELDADLAKNLIAQDRDDYTNNDYRRDMTVLAVQTTAKVAKLYAPAFVVGAASLACFIGSHKIMSTRNAGLMAAYAALDKGFKEYRDRVLAEVGEDKERELRYGWQEREIVEETKEGPQVKVVKTAGPSAGKSIYARFFAEGNTNWRPTPVYNKIFLKAQQDYATQMLRARGHIFLNEVYDALGLERTKEGAVVGWLLGHGDDYVDFGIFDGDYEGVRDFVNGYEASVLLDFNVCGVIYDKI